MRTSSHTPSLSRFIHTVIILILAAGVLLIIGLLFFKPQIPDSFQIYWTRYFPSQVVTTQESNIIPIIPIIPIQKDTVVRTGSGNTVLPEFSRLPADFPKDIPIYPGSTLAFSFSPLREGQKTFTTSFNVNPELGNIDKVLAYYTDEMSKNGWDVQPIAQVGLGSALSATKEGLSMTVSVFGNAQGISVNTAYSPIVGSR